VKNGLHNLNAVDDFGVANTDLLLPKSPAAIWVLSAPTIDDDTAPRIAITDQPFTVGRDSSSSLAKAYNK
jgi:hypothetical protein